MKKTLAMLLALVMMLSLFAGCTKTPDPTEAPAKDPTNAPATEAPKDDPTEAPETPTEAPAAEEKVLRISGVPTNENKSGFNHTFNSGNNYVGPMIWDSLLDYDIAAGKYVPTLAEKAEVSADGMTWTVTLKDAKWHDGTPVTAADVVFTYNACMKAAGSTSSLMSLVKGYDAAVEGEADTIEGIVAKDDKTVVFEFTAPNYIFERALGNNCFAILPAHCFEGVAWADVTTYAEYWSSPIGTGAYKIAETAWPDYIKLTRNDDYHSAPAGIKDILVTIYEDSTASMADLMAGKMHFANGMSEVDANTVMGAQPQMKMSVLDSAYYRIFFFNCSSKENARPDLKNDKVRQGISKIIDRQAIVDYIGAQGSVSTTLSVTDFNTDIPLWTRDLEGGKKLLEEGGFDFSKPIRLYCYYTDQESIDIMAIVQQNLEEAGIQVELTVDNTDVWGVLYDRLDFDLAYGGGFGEDIHAYNFFSTGQVYDAWFTEDILDHFKNTFKVWFDQYSQTPDAAGRTALMDQIQVQFVEDCYVLPCWFRNSLWVIDENLTGLEPWATDFDNIAKIDFSKWSLK